MITHMLNIVQSTYPEVENLPGPEKSTVELRCKTTTRAQNHALFDTEPIQSVNT